MGTRVAARSCRAKKKGQKRQKTRELEACVAGRGPALIRALSYGSLLAATPTWSVCACQSSSAEAHQPTPPQRSQTLDVRCRLLPLLALTRIRLASSPPPRGAGERKKKKRKKERNSR